MHSCLPPCVRTSTMQHTTHRQSHGLWDVPIPGWSVPGQWKQPRLVLKGFKLYETIQEPRLVATWLRAGALPTTTCRQCKLFTCLFGENDCARSSSRKEIYGELGRPHGRQVSRLQSESPCRPPAKGRRLHDWMRPFARPEGDLPSRKNILRRELCPLRGLWLIATQDYYPSVIWHSCWKWPI